MTDDDSATYIQEKFLRNRPIGNLIICLQKLAKDNSYYKPDYRKAILLEAARRLNEINNQVRSLRDS